MQCCQATYHKKIRESSFTFMHMCSSMCTAVDSHVYYHMYIWNTSLDMESMQNVGIVQLQSQKGGKTRDFLLAVGACKQKISRILGIFAIHP